LTQRSGGKEIMAIQRFFTRRRIRRYQRKLRERIALLIILAFFILNFCLCFGVGLVTTALQNIGILPTPTPTPADGHIQQIGFAETTWIKPCTIAYFS
jgi:hypothetical protein